MQLPNWSRRTWVRFVVVLVAAASISLPALSSANRAGVAQTDDPSAEREEVRAEKAEAAAEVDTLQSTDAEVTAALADLQENVAGQEALLGEAERAAAEAEQAYADAMAAVDAKNAEIAQLEERVRDFAVEAFINPPAEDAMAALEADDPQEAAERRALLELQNERDSDILDQLAAAKEDLKVQEQLAAEAAQVAEDKRAEAAARLDEVEAARDQQAAFAVEVQNRLDHALAEVAALEKLDAELSEEIRKQQEELARQAEIARAQELAAQQAAQQAAAQQSVADDSSSSPSAPSAPIDSQVSGSGSIVSVSCPGGGSISISSSVSGNLASMLEAASADGVMLCGGGYRSPDAQIAVRQSNCGTSYYAIYQMPSSSCSPPTAPPGTSMHEQGLAIDFTCDGGGAISSQSSHCFTWLAANAASYGFYNLPSEPWHWSSNGN